jgi:hypothetical protein
MLACPIAESIMSLQALALGASHVWLGRTALWGLAVGVSKIWPAPSGYPS